VDITDVALLALSFGTAHGSVMYNQAADLNADGQIDILDVAIIASDFGTPALA
jgi:fructose/tagatose bisphosphate aldolase